MQQQQQIVDMDASLKCFITLQMKGQSQSAADSLRRTPIGGGLELMLMHELFKHEKNQRRGLMEKTRETRSVRRLNRQQKSVGGILASDHVV